MERWQQIESLFQQALERDPAERNAWLREACQGDSDLRREVASLLANHQAAADSQPWAAAAAAKLIDSPTSLEPGQCLGPYRIESFLAAGGMGEVYRATDTRLNRTVAVKLSAGRFSERFEREARVIASLNHPNICTLYDVGPNYLVMEYVEGPTLAERIQQGPIPLADALEIARQMAAALEEAHQRLVVHRDFKPGNVKIKPDRTVKVLDFGLAKLPAMQTGAGTSATDSPTLTMAATQAGVLLGTAAYMSPEQARGEPVDKRGDVWAFGVVLWEMLTGKRLFDGKTTSDVLAAVIRDEPDLAQVPAKVRPLLRRCLEKDPQRRLRDIGDTWLLLEEGQEAPPSRRPLLPWVVAAVLAMALVADGFLHFRERPAELPVLRFLLAPPEKTSFNASMLSQLGPPVVSPDGRRVAFVATREDRSRQIWVQPLDAVSAHPLAGTDNAIYPFWSPDSKWLGFFADGNLKRIDVSGGAPVTLCDSSLNSKGGTWNQEGVIVFSPSVYSPLYRISASGGTARPVTSLDAPRHETSHRLPWFLPDGRHFLYTARTGMSASNGWIRIASLDYPSDSRTLMALPLPSNAVYANGYLLFTNQNTLMAQPFDAKRLATTGEAIHVAEHVEYSPGGVVAMFSASANGVLAYETGGGEENHKLTWFDRTGKPLSPIGNLPNLLEFRLSPDGNSVAAVLTQSHNQDLWILNIQRGRPTRFTFDPAIDAVPVWSPDGRSIVFASNRKGHFDLYLKPADQTRNEESLYADDFDKIPSSWSPDGKFLLYNTMAMGQTVNSNIWVLPMKGENKPFPFAQTTITVIHGGNAHFSPNGRWVAYGSSDSGQAEIYVAPFPGPGAKQQVSINGGGSAVWRRDGREIFYLSRSNQLMAAEVSEDGAALKIGAVQALFGPIAQLAGPAYDISPEGKRILTTAAIETNALERLTVVQNWTAGLKK
jgi:serine/threonine protein kinase